MRLCEAYHKVQRLREEGPLLLKECSQYIAFCEAELARLTERRLSFEASGSLTAVSGSHNASQARFFQAADFAAADVHVASGISAIFKSAETECRNLLQQAHAQLDAVLHGAEAAAEAEVPVDEAAAEEPFSSDSASSEFSSED